MKRGRGVRRWLAVVLAAAAVGVAAARDRPEAPVATAPEAGSRALERFEFVAPRMGTLFKITLYASDAVMAERAAQAAFARVAELNRVLSDYDPDSEAMRLCREPPGRAVPVSADLFAVLALGQELAQRTGGAFDVTLGSVAGLWRDARLTRSLPTVAARQAALAAAGHRHLRLEATARRVTLTVAGLRLDFGGIAKGYAADAALAVLRDQGVPRALVAASGDLALGDAPPDAAGWRVALEPFGGAGGRTQTLVAANVGISTSGDAEQFVEIGGIRYSHLVDPRTGLGLTSPLAVSVVARSGARADALATACSVLAATAEDRIAECVGDGARVLVMRRAADGMVATAGYGASPPGVRTGW